MINLIRSVVQLVVPTFRITKLIIFPTSNLNISNLQSKDNKYIKTILFENIFIRNYE